MAKIKVHELAKELEVQSKDILAFLQDKGIEAKAAQSSVDEAASQLVRGAFGKGVKSASAGKAEVPQKKDAAEETVKAAVKEEETKAPVREKPKPAKTAEAPKGDAPKKKKTIIVVNNPQNSRMQGQRPAQGQGGNASPLIISHFIVPQLRFVVRTNK